jgi:hypothetical protein
LFLSLKGAKALRKRKELEMNGRLSSLRILCAFAPLRENYSVQL